LALISHFLFLTKGTTDMHSWRTRGRATGRAMVLLVGLTVCLLPLIWTILAALGLEPDGRGWRGSLTLDNFLGVTAFEPEFGSEFAYTVAVTVTATLLTIALAFPAAYRLARAHLAWVDRLMPALLVLAVSPIIAYALPLAAIIRQIGLYGTFPGLVLAFTGAQLPLAIWLLRGYVIRVSPLLEEAARLDGASWWGVVVRVILPVAAGGVIATGVLVFVLDWNLFLLPTLLAEGSPHLLTVTMRDFFAFERELDWPTAAAALIVSLAPAFLLVFTTQRALEGLILVPEEASS
jgi:multiple sugar transport system permease protein